MPKNPKQIAFEEVARAATSAGVDKLARAVKTTLGPVGRCAVIDRGWGEPIVTKDGARVAEEVELTDPYQNMAARLMRQAAEKTHKQAGDGSTTATVLAESIFKLGLRRVIGGVNSMVLARGLKTATERAIEELKKLAVPVKSDDQILAIATIAANQDRLIGKTITDALAKVGKEGVITIEEGKELQSTVDVVEGMKFDRGYLSPHFVTNPDKMVCDLQNPFILILEEKISALPKIVPILEKVLQTKRPLLIIAEDVEGEVLATLVVNKLKGVLKCAAVKAPAYGDRRKAMLQDIAVLTGGRAIFKDLGIEPEQIRTSDLGQAKKVTITSEDTILVGGAGDKKDIDGRAREIRQDLEKTESEYDREKLQERLAKLVGGVAVIRVGAATESEMKERKVRFEGALNATRAAQEEGILPGGGVSLLRVADALKDVAMDLKEEQAGVQVIREALEAPIRQLCINCGIEPATVLRGVRKEKNRNFGFNLLSEEFVDMVKDGVIDAAKVMRIALLNACSVATILLTTDTLVTAVPKKKDDDEDHHHHHHDDYEGMDDF
jgi:chaperonin GroEL